jgi:hypothetical protein
LSRFTGDDGFTKEPIAEQKKSVWTMIALTALDQLRQKQAWALSQIVSSGVSIGSDGIGGGAQTGIFKRLG